MTVEICQTSNMLKTKFMPNVIKQKKELKIRCTRNH